MITCAQCGAEVALPYHCKYCGGYFCPEHRLPENHGCPKLPRGSLGTKLGVEASKQAIRKVRLRSGRIVDFDRNRITSDIFRRTKNLDVARELSDEVVRILEQKYAGKIPTLKDIHYVVQKVLAEYQERYRLKPRRQRIAGGRTKGHIPHRRLLDGLRYIGENLQDLLPHLPLIIGVASLIFGISIAWICAPSTPQPEPSTPQPESPYPPNYYDNAREYVATHYGLVGEKNIKNLVDFLNQVKLRDYELNVFDCSEASSMLEWLLEGAGFHALIAFNGSWIFGHTWVLVMLEDGENVAIEATALTQNNYAPPGIIEAPDGSFREYTYEYKMFLEWKEKYPPYLYDYNPNITFEEWKQKYLIQPPQPLGIPSRETYYNPPRTYESPADAMTKSEWDWWNVPPYNSMEPFNGWN